MRTLSATLTTAQKEISSPPIWKVILSRTGQTTRGYDQTRLWKITQTESPSSYTAELVLNNSDTILTSLDFEHYQAVISYGYDTGVARSAWVAASTYAIDAIVIPTPANTNGYQYRCSIAGVAGSAEPTWPTDLGVTVASSAATFEMDGNTGEEYSRIAPLRVRIQNLLSGRGILRCILQANGIPNQLAEDKAEATYDLTSGDTQTVKTLLTAVAGTALTAYANYTPYTVTYDSEDAVIDTFKPQDFFSIRVNDDRLDKIQELLDYTGSKMRPQNDGNLHIQDPTISGTAYNYEYKFNVSGDHNFWGKSVRLRFVNPNKEVVRSHPDHATQYSAAATSNPSYDLAPKIHTTYARLASTAEANSIASARIERYELDAERGFATVPMNVGQELWDYVKVTDSRQNDTRIGNVQYLQREVEIKQGNQPLTWITRISMGKVSQLSLIENMATAAVGERAGPTFTDIISVINDLSLNIDDLVRIINTVVDAVDDIKNSIPSTESRGLVEIATIAETNTGTDVTRAVSPDGLAGSVFGTKVIGIIAVNATTALTVADGKAYIPIPAALNGMNLTRAQAIVITAGTTNATTIDIYNVTDSQDMLSTAISIASGATVGTVGTVNTTYDDVATNDVLRVDVTTMSTTAPLGLLVVLEFRLP